MPNDLKPFRCLNCNAIYGTTDGVRLYCGEIAIFTLKVTPTCSVCGEHRTWRPVALVHRPIITVFETAPVIDTKELEKTVVQIVQSAMNP